MKKNLFLMALVSLFAAATFTSCDKDDDNDSATSVIAGGVLSGEVVGLGDANPDSINAIMYYGDNYNEFVVVGSATLADGKLTLKLNETVDDKFLGAISANLPSGVKVSDDKVKTAEASVTVFKEGSPIGSFFYRTANSKDGEADITYANGDVSITGTSTANDGDTESYNVHLKKGWNIIYEKETENTAAETEHEEHTTATPSGVKWYYKDDTL